MVRHDVGSAAGAETSCYIPGRGFATIQGVPLIRTRSLPKHDLDARACRDLRVGALGGHEGGQNDEDARKCK